MFTGIVQGIATIIDVKNHADYRSHTLEFPEGALKDVALGASISVAGCCLTVTKVTDRCAEFDLVEETLRCTTLGDAASGMMVNFERSLRVGDEIGGHLLSGHVDTVAKVVAVRALENTKEVTFEIDPAWTRFLFAKGYVALNGASLTLVNVDRETNRFCVALIPETLSRTTFAKIESGQRINVEVDRTTQAVVETVERLMASRS